MLGAIILILVLLFPQGIAGFTKQLFDRLKRKPVAGETPIPASTLIARGDGPSSRPVPLKRNRSRGSQPPKGKEQSP